MKEIQLFPQITEETEENLLTDQKGETAKTVIRSPRNGHSKSAYHYASTVVQPLLNADTNEPAGSPTPEESSLPVPKIIAEYVDDDSNPVDCGNDVSEVHDVTATPRRIRMRSLSGGAYRLSPVPPSSGRMRRQSGDDVLSGGASPLRRAAFLDSFRPRSKSDSKSKKPTFLSTLKNSFFSTSAGTPSTNSSANSSRKNSLEKPDPFFDPDPYRQRSGSETKGGPMSKVIDMFRNRSNSMSNEQQAKKSWNSSRGNVLSRRYSVGTDRRKRPMISTYRSLELPIDYFQCHRSETLHDMQYQEDVLAVPKFFDSNKCYDIMPISGKVLILDNKLQVDKAFHSLVGNLLRAAPIWDSSKMEFIGMLTITDFIDVLILYYDSSEEQLKGLEGQKICTWRRVTSKPDNFIHIHPEASLTDAIKMLVYQQVHRLPVFDPTTSSVLFVLTHKRILKYFYLFGLGKNNQRPEIFPKPSCLRKTIRELKIGTYENIATATLEMTVIEALRIFVKRKVSALPVLDNGAVINLYAKFDVLALAKESTYRNLDMTIKDALQERGEVFEKVVTCTQDSTIGEVIDKIIDFEVHRIVIVDSNSSVVGMISLSDIIKFLVLQPLDLLESPISPLEDSLCSPTEYFDAKEDSIEIPFPEEMQLRNLIEKFNNKEQDLFAPNQNNDNEECSLINNGEEFPYSIDSNDNITDFGFETQNELLKHHRIHQTLSENIEKLEISAD